ncbi:hypothetical protein pb186bvf_004054 [Paramecium bursaria]
MSRGGPKSQVMFDGEQRSSIRTYNNNANKQQGFSIGWDVDQSSKNDTKLAGKVGQTSKTSYIPAYQAQTYVTPEQDEQYLRQLYQQELAQKQQIAQQQAYQKPQPQQYYEPPKQYDDEDDIYAKYQAKMGGSGQKPTQQQPAYQQPYAQPTYDKPPQYPTQLGNNYQPPAYQPQGYQAPSNPISGYPSPQEDDSLSQFSQMHPILQQHKITSLKNKTSNIFNTDMNQQDDTLSRQSNRVSLNKKKEFDDTSHKGYGNFYAKTDYVAQPIHVVNRNKVNNQIFPQY